MGLMNIDIKKSYRNRHEDVINDFFIPTLKESVLYQRAVGYFTLGALCNLTAGIIPLIQNGGKVEVICSPLLVQEDIEILSKGNNIQNHQIIKRLMEQLVDTDNEDETIKMDLIANLIQAELIQIKIAVNPTGIYHEKVGILQDKNSDYIAFSGSSNETVNAQLNNYESFKVFKSWDPAIADYALDEKQHFAELWNGDKKGLIIFNLTDAVKNQILTKYKESESLESAIKKFNEKFYNTSFVRKKELYPYQKQAIKEFEENNYNHFFEMATGTGKTFTSVHALKALNEVKGKVFNIILVPQIDLQHQWYKELKDSGIEKIYTLGGNMSSSSWSDDFQKALIDFSRANKSVYYIAIYDSFFSKLYNKLGKIKELSLIIDEAHNLSSNQLNKLPINAKYRLGLSATPEKHSIDETEKIISYFIKDKKSFKYSIDEAIANKFLSRYYYQPIFVYLTDEEFEKYKSYTIKVVVERSQKNVDYDKVQRLLNERSLVIKKASGKIDKLHELTLDQSYSFINSVVYCGQGKEDGEEERIIDKVTKVLYDERKLRVSTFTSATIDRKRVLDEFENGYYDTLVAIKCFDEGVDVPSLDKIYIMASDRLKRQTVQRRGRVLRISKETGKDFAYIYDFIVLPPIDADSNIGKNLVVNEFYRVHEYMRLAENKKIVASTINDIEMQFNITEEDYND